MAAITYPLTIPAILRATEFNFDLDYSSIELAPTGGGLLARDLGVTLWQLSINCPPEKSTRYDALRAWVDLLEGGVQKFLAYDIRRPYPRAYPTGFTGLTRAGGGSFDGTCNIDTVNADNKRITLSTLPAAFQFTAGDYIGFTYATTFLALHKIIADATADGSGVAIVEVRSHVRPGWTADSTANLVRPTALMSLVPGSYKPQPNVGLGSISFQAMQTFAPT